MAGEASHGLRGPNAPISPRMHPKRALSLLCNGPDAPEAFTNNHDRNFISNPLMKLPFNILLIQSVSSAESPLSNFYVLSDVKDLRIYKELL